MAPSTTSTSISTFLMSRGTLLVLEPLRQTNADLKSANEVLVLIHEMVLAYCSPFLITILIIMIIIATHGERKSRIMQINGKKEEIFSLIGLPPSFLAASPLAPHAFTRV